MDTTTPHKRRAITYTKREGHPRVEYWTVDADGGIKELSPTVWHKSNLPDMTTPERLEEVAALIYKKKQTQFNRRVDDNQWLRTQTTDKPFTVLCAHCGFVV